MASRITDKDLDALALRINRTTGSPETYMTADDTHPRGRRINVGHYHTSSAYGGVCLHRTTNESGGVTCPIGNYYRPKRELYDAMHAYIAGYEAGKGV